MRAATWLSAGVFVLMGVWLGLGLRSEVLYQSSLSFQRFVAMENLITEQLEEQKTLTRQLRRLRLEPPALIQRRATARLKSELRALEAKAGLAPVQGEGLQIVLSDAPLPSVPASNPNAYLVHDIDLLELVNTLNAAGAKAIAINGQRILPTTAIHCVGPVISINAVRTAPPIEVLAVGPPLRLKAAVLARGGIVSLIRLYGLPVWIRVRMVTVPAFHPVPLS